MNNNVLPNTNNNNFIHSLITKIVLYAKHKYGLTIGITDQRKLVEDVYRHYIEHCNEYHVMVCSVDPFKFLAWAGLTLYHDIKIQSGRKRQYLHSAIAVMYAILRKNGRTLNRDFVIKLIHMTQHDKDVKNDKLAIGRNGLYMAFRSANEVEVA